jgi:solute carrier family 45 protein 1/2/4
LLTLHRLQMVWLTIFSHGSTYLASLGIPELHISLIWALAPICGAVAPPVVGVLSDRCRLPWGRRRPFIVFGAATVILAITALAWITPIAKFICALHGMPSMAGSIIHYWAIFWIILLNIGIQTLQSASRALILDVCPPEQQALASAWAGRFTGFGNIVGYVLGSVPLPLLCGGPEAWRFRWMAACAVVTLCITVPLGVLSINEQTPHIPVYYDDEGQTIEPFIARTLKGIRQSIISMPPKAKQVCRVQFFSAMGWFGFLFYNTTYISDLYLDDTGEVGMVHGSAHRDMGMRFATTASLLFAVVALGMNIILPYVKSNSHDSTGAWKARLRFLRQTHILWSFGAILYTLLTLSTFIVSSSTGGTVTIAVAGVAWGINQWAPFALIGEEIAAHEAEREMLVEQGGKGAVVNQSGAMLGVHSAAICVPQVIAALVSSVVFWVAARFGIEGAVGWVLRFSGVAGAVAAWFAWRL